MNTMTEEQKDQFQRPGDPFIMHLLFKEPVQMPSQERVQQVIESYCGKSQLVSYDPQNVAIFALKEYIAKFKDGEAPSQLIVTNCTDFDSESIPEMVKGQMWNSSEYKDRIFEECKYKVSAMDMLTAGLEAKQRATVDMAFLKALVELYPECEAVYFHNCGKLFLAEQIRESDDDPLSEFIRFAVNVRYFFVRQTEPERMIVDTIGMNTLFMPDLQYYFHTMDPNWVVNHAYDVAIYLLENDCPIKNGETISGISNGDFNPDLKWKCHYQDSILEPIREVLDIHMNEYAALSEDEAINNQKQY